MKTPTTSDVDLLKQLSKEMGRPQYDGFEAEVEKEGEFHIHEREGKASKAALNIAKELERRGWKIQGTDKGTLFTRPVS